MDYTLSGFTAGMPSPAQYFSDIIQKVPTALDSLATYLNYPIVEKMAWIVLVCWFIFSLLSTD